jgi:site-specific DNA-adenine methylase
MIPYPGGKVRLAQTIVSFLPKRGRTYCEPFVGRGSVFFAAASRHQFKRWWLNDIATAPFFEAIMRIGDTVEVPPRVVEEYYRQWELSRRDDERANILEPYLTFGGGGYGKGGFGNKKGASQSGYASTIRECHRLLHNTSPRITALDWRDMRLERLTGDDVVFLDPPYPNADVRSYRNDKVNHEELVDCLLRAKFRWPLSGYAHPLLCRLGEPFWAREVKLLSIRGEQEPRTECLWSNFASGSSQRHSLPVALNRKLRTLADAASLSFAALDAEIDEGLQTVANDWSALVPFLLEMHRRLSAPGKRTDLRKDAPSGLTWTQWVESKRKKLGRSLRTIQHLLRGKTQASLARQARVRPRAGHAQGSEYLSEDAMDIATEMSRLVLKLRHNSQYRTSYRRRLELLAEHFLKITGQVPAPRNDDAPLARIGSTSSEPGWKM